MMATRLFDGPVIALLLASLVVSTPAASLAQAAPAQTAAEPQRAPPSPAAPRVPVPQLELDRIKRALTREPTLDMNEQQLRFYVEIVAKQPRFAEYLKGYDLFNGPTRRGNPMSHQEFLSLVTPKELYGSAGIKPVELLQFALTNWVGQALIKRALDDLGNAKTERQMQDIRDRIDAELRALTGVGDN